MKKTQPRIPVPQPKQPDTQAMLREMRQMQLELDTLKKSILSETNMRALESDLTREFQHLKAEVKESIKKNTHTVEKMEAEVKFLKEDMGRIMSLEEEMNRLNMKSLTRELESLKTKSHWLEGKMGAFDLDPVIEKISEIEDKIKIMKASQPLILE